MSGNIENECHRYVDMWAMPGIHPTNIELLQRLKSADSRHFTKGMNVIGTISERIPAEGWHQTHVVGLRSDLWRPAKGEIAKTLAALKRQRKQWHKDQLRLSGRLSTDQADRLNAQLETDHVWQLEESDIESRRLVLKLFKNTGQTTRWCGTLEEMTTSEVHNSLGSRRNLITLLAILPGSQHVVTIQENHRTFRFPALFTFSFYDGQKMWYVRLQQRWVSLGPDFDVYIDGTWIGILDSQLFCFGSDGYLDLSDHELLNDTEFVDLLTLFMSSVGYHRSIRRTIRRRVAETLKGRSHVHLIDHEELRLRHNGRSAA